MLQSLIAAGTPEVRTKFFSAIPIGRFSIPEDTSNTACYLCSGKASMIMGVCMEIDGERYI